MELPDMFVTASVCYVLSHIVNKKKYTLKYEQAKVSAN